MASIIFTAKDIFDQDFKREVRGYNKDEVNEFLDDVIKDYETYAKYDLTKDFIDPDGIEKTPHDYLYFQAMAEAKEAMYDYLIKRDNVTKQDLKNNETIKAYQELAEIVTMESGHSISKSGINHYFRKIRDLVNKHKEKNEN